MAAPWQAWTGGIRAMVLAAISACAVRDVPEGTSNCDFECTSTCPPGFDCRDGYCVKPDFSGSCVGGPGGPETRNECSGEDDALTLAPLAPIRACAGQEVDVPLEVTGGSGPFEWSLLSTDAGLMLDASAAAR